MRMKYSMPDSIKIGFLLTVLGVAGGAAMAQDPKVQVSIAALSLPATSSGELHWKAGDEMQTQPLQLSKRYFSDPVEPTSPIIHFYEKPITERLPDVPLPEPLLTVTLSSDLREAFVVLLGKNGDEKKPVWRSVVLDGKGWPDGTLRVVNVDTQPVKLVYPRKELILKPKEHVEFAHTDWYEPFPIKIFQMRPMEKIVFSSKWRVTHGRREICFLSKERGSISLRSLLVLNQD
jgi:hypothetical protein